MIIAAKVKHFLDSHHIHYRVFMHERTHSLSEAIRVLDFSKDHVLQAVLLKDSVGVILAVLPLSLELDLAEIASQTGRHFTVVPQSDADRFFDDCEPGSHPPFGKAYNIPVVLDNSIKSLESVTFEAGCHTALLQLSAADFQFLMEGTPSFSLAKTKSLTDVVPMTAKILHDKETDFPSLPPIARQILAIIDPVSKDAVKQLSDLISNDEAIRSHIIGCANHFLKEGQILEQPTEIEQIISNVLGFNTVSHIAVGITAGRTMQIPAEGPLGLYAFWRHALYAGALAKKMAEQIPAIYALDPQYCYLAGFFHNFGYLLLGHLFPPEFSLLNRWLLLHPKTPIEILEKRLVGLGKAMQMLDGGHAGLGSWLMGHWGMPEEIVVSSKYHHCPNYRGEFWHYVLLLQLVNQLLKPYGLGDGPSGKVKPEKYHPLGLKPGVVERCLTSVQSDMQSLDKMALNLVN